MLKKVLLALGAVVVVVVAGFLILASTQADHSHLERSVVVAAAPTDMVAFAHDLKGVNEWSPWDEIDPGMTREYSEPSSGVGAWYHWKGNDEVGEGRMTIRTATDEQVVMDLHFIAPFEAKAVSTVSWKADGDGTKVTWAFDQDNQFTSKMFMVFMDFESFIGAEYERGLAMLEPMVEAAAKQRMAEAAAKSAQDAPGDPAPADNAPASDAAPADGAADGDAAPDAAAADPSAPGDDAPTDGATP